MYLSFIVIGKNESKNLKRCITSIKSFVDFNNLTNWECIYIDSNSSDNSIDIVKQYSFVKIFKIIGYTNAAIARNAGAKIAIGEFLFFIDADMQLNKNFFAYISDSNQRIKYDFVSGELQNILMNEHDEVVGHSLFYNIKKDKYLSYVGGIFIIKNIIFKKVNGMKVYFDKAQDLEFGFRLANQGIKLLRKKETIAFHYTIDYMDVKRKLLMIKKNDFSYLAMAYRENFLGKAIYSHLFRKNYTFVLLLVSAFASIFNIYFFLIYIFLQSARLIVYKRKYATNLMYFLVKDIKLLLSFIFFYVPKRKEYKVKEII